MDHCSCTNCCIFDVKLKKLSNITDVSFINHITYKKELIFTAFCCSI